MQAVARFDGVAAFLQEAKPRLVARDNGVLPGVAAGFAVKPSVDVAFGEEPVSDVKIPTGARVNFPSLVEAGKRIDGADSYEPQPQIPRSPFGITR